MRANGSALEAQPQACRHNTQPDTNTRASPSAASGLTGAVGEEGMAAANVVSPALQNSPAPLGGFQFIRLDDFFLSAVCLFISVLRET